MPAVRTALVIGAGAAGTASAILLAEGGVDVDLVELRPGVDRAGSGITLQGNALRVLRRLGVWHEVLAHGYAFDTVGMRAPDGDGTLVVELTDVRTGGPELPATVGMPRPDLARILLRRAGQAGVRVRTGTRVTGLRQDGTGVDVTTADGASARYDVVIGADGVRSWTRAALGIDLRTTRLGMGIWRVFTGRPPGVTRTDLYYGGAAYIAGYCPTGEDSLYAYLVEPAQDRADLGPQQKLAAVRALAAHYHGPWDDIRDRIDDPARISYTLFETHLLPAPWNRGRVVLIGDAAHTCPPTLAQGAAMALEDAAVLAELLVARSTPDQHLWDEFTARRFDRARTVVQASVQLASWLLEREQGDVPALMRSVTTLVERPA